MKGFVPFKSLVLFFFLSLYPKGFLFGQCTFTISSTPITCYGGSSVVTIIPDSPGSYTYSFGITTNNTGIFPGIVAGGPYTWGVSDRLSCNFNGTPLTISQPAMPDPPVVSGAPQACRGSSIYEYSALPGMTNYTWSVSAGGTLLNGGTTNTIHVSWNTSGNQTVSVSYTDQNGCVTPSGSLNVVVNESIPVNVSISTQNTNICQGTPATFTAAAVNGGPSPIYQWKINGINTGENSSVFTSSTLNNNDRISVDLISSVTCPSSPVVTSNIITMTVNSLRYPQVSIVESINPVCAGQPVTFQATDIIEGGVDPSFTWKVNGVITGPDAPEFTISAPTDNDQIQVTMVSSVTCAVNPALSNSVTIDVTPLPVLNTVLADQLFCSGTATAAIELNGEPAGVVFDISGGGSVGLSDRTGVTSLPSFVPIAGNARISITPKANNCIGLPVSFNITVNPVPVATAPGNLSYCNGVPTSELALTGAPGTVLFDITGGGSVGLQDQLGVSVIPSFIPVTGSAVITLTPKANGCTGATVTFNVTVHEIPAAIRPANQSWCNGVQTTSLPLVGSPPGLVFDISGGSTIGLADISNVTSVPAFMPVTGTAVLTIIPKANGCAGPGVTFNADVNPTPVVNIIPDQFYCDGMPGSPVTLSGSPGNVVFDISGGTLTGLPDQTGVNAIPAFTPVTGISTVSVTPRANGCTGAPRSFTLTVSPNVPVSVSITAGANPVCSGSPVTYTAHPVNGGTSPSYQWFVNGIIQAGNNQTFTYTPLTGDRITARLNSSLACTSGNPAGSNEIIMSVFSGAPSVPSTPIPRDGQANSICPVAPGLEYHIPAVPDAVSYTWNFPAGWTITSGQGTTSVIVTAGIQTTGNKNITVTAVNSCGSTTSAPLVVSVGTFASVEAGPDQVVCSGTLSVRMNGSLAGATGNNDWSWSAPSGTFSPNNRKLDADYNIPASIINGGSVLITMNARAEGTCPVATDHMTVMVRPVPAATISIQGENPVCAGSSSTVLITSVPGTTVTYRINAGAAQTVAVGPSGSASLATGALNTSATYSLVSVGYATAPQCLAASAGTVTITVNPLATVNAGADQQVCSSSPQVQLAGSVGGGAVSGTWTGGTGTFAPDRTALNATYTPSAAEIAAGSVTLTLTTNDPAGPCNSFSDNIVIIILQEAIANAGPPQTVCVGSPVSLSGTIGGSATSSVWSGGTGTFTPGTGSLNTVYIPGVPDIAAGHVTLILTTNDPAGPCSAASSQTEITFNIPVTVNAGPDQTICGGSTVSLSGSISGGAQTGMWSGGTGAFSDAGSPNTTYIPGAADISSGFVTLTLTSSDPDGPCTSSSDQVRITINTQPTVNAGPDQVICAGSSVTLNGSIGGTATSATWSGGTGSFSPNAGALNAVYQPGVAEVSSGAVTLTLTTNDPAGVCTAISDQLTININQQAVVNAGVNQTICSNSSAVLSGSIGGSATSATWSGGNGTFSPNANTLNASYTPSAAERTTGTVTLTLTTDDPSGPCNSASATTTITIRRAVQITTQPSNIGVCASFPAVFSVVATGDALNYQWYKGGTPVQNTALITGATTNTLRFSQVTLADGGNYYVVVSGVAQCAPVTSNQVSLNVDQAILITAQPASLTICRRMNAIFSVTADANGDPLTYQWRRNGTNIPGANSSTYTLNNVTATDAGSYDVVISGTAGYMCSSAQSASAALTVTPDVETPVFFAGSSSVRCQSPGAVAYPASATNSSGITYSLDAASISSGNTINSSTGLVSFTAAWTGTSTVTASASGCNSPATASHSVTITPSVAVPVFSSGSTSTRCQGTGTVAYQATALNSTSITYSLDAASLAAGNTIVSSTGNVTYSSSWSGTSVITASAAGCNGPALSSHTVTITPTVGRPVFAPGALSSRCQAAEVVSYQATATNSTGITYSLDAASLAAGNSINSATGSVTWVASWSGTSTITAVAAGCNGPLTSTHTVTSSPLISVPVFSSGAASTRCQGDGTISYTATAANSTAISYSLDATSLSSGNTINPATGAVTFSAAWSGVSVITATASGCGGPLTATHTVTVNGLSSGGAISPSNSIICSGAAAGLLTLSGYNGSVLRWEYSTNAGGTWTPVSNTSSTYLPAVNQSSIFRAVIQNGTCPPVYSSPASIGVIPLRDPVITTIPAPPVICLGQSATLMANSGSMDGPFMNGSFTNANPIGWCRDNQCTGSFLPAHRDNETTGFWGETNGPKEFAGIIYNSQDGKFAVAGGALTSTLETPLFSIFGDPPATLYWRDAYNLVNGAYARIEISTNGGASYTTLAQFTGSTGNYQNFRQEQIDLTPYLGQTNLRIRFTYSGTASSSWAIDDVRVTPQGAAPAPGYTWTSNPGNYTVSGDSIVVTPTVTTSYTLTTSITTPYGTCPLGSAVVSVIVNPLPECIITGPDAVCPTQSISFSAPAGMTSYTWNISGNGTILSSRTAQNITVRPGTLCNSDFVLTLTIIDSNGCTSTCTKTVQVADNIPPVIAGCPADQEFCEVPAHTYTIPALTNISDNCVNPLTVSFTISGATSRAGQGNNASGAFNNGTSTIAWTVTDSCGNVTNCTTAITINPAPVTSPIYHQ